MTDVQVAELIALVKLRYPHAKLGLESADPERAMAGMVKVWTMSLADVPYEAAERALQVWFRTQKWAPDPSEIREMAAHELLDLPEPEEAWGIARGAIASYYPGHPFTYAMPGAIRNALHAIGGIHNLKMSETPSRDRDAFIKAYTIYRRREMEMAVLDAPAIDEPKLRVIGG